MTMARTLGFDWTLPAAPPLRKPPLSLLDLASTLINVDDSFAARQDALEKLASAQARVEAGASEDALDALALADVMASTTAKELADVQRWEGGFEYWPELSNDAAMEIFEIDSGSTKLTDANPPAKAWYDPFEVVARDDNSMFPSGYLTMRERQNRALRALAAHESWQAEREFWTGASVPTNLHLTASPDSTTSSAHRTIDAWDDPTAAPGTVLGTAVGIKQSLAALDQAIARSDAGVGMIHATPFIVQLWSSAYPFLRDSAGRIFTVNFNLIVPGYGYPGTGPDDVDRSVTDAVTNSTTTVTSAAANFTNADVGRPVSGDSITDGATIVSVTDEHTIVISIAATGSGSSQDLTISGTGGDAGGSPVQWAYATDTVYRLAGAARTLPWDFRETSPEMTVNNSVEVRAERAHALITNRLLRAAVLVDTTTP